MKENKNIIIIILIIIAIIFGIIALYFGIENMKIKNDEGIQQIESEKKDSEIEKNEISVDSNDKYDDNEDKVTLNDEKITTNDLFGFDSQSMILVKVVDNDLFYWYGNEQSNNMFWTASTMDNKYIKLDSNVKRVKTFCLGTDTTVSFLAIKKDGSVYVIKLDSQNNKVLYEEYEPFAGIKIDDITSIRGYTGMTSGINAKVTLLDGTQKEINYQY